MAFQTNPMGDLPPRIGKGTIPPNIRHARHYVIV